MDLLYRLGSNGAVNELLKEVLGDTEHPIFVDDESSTEEFFEYLRLAGEDDARRARGTRLCPIDWLVGLPPNAPEAVRSEACSRTQYGVGGISYLLDCMSRQASSSRRSHYI